MLTPPAPLSAHRKRKYSKVFREMEGNITVNLYISCVDISGAMFFWQRP